VVRTALQAMAAVLGGAQSLHTNSLDEAYALPSEHAVTLALRTQQVLAYESGVAAVADPLGGSYFVERLTLDMESAANEYIRRIDDMGGMIPAIEAGFPQTEIAGASYRYQREVEDGERVVVGVNRFQSDDQPIELLQIDESSGRHQSEKLAGAAQAAEWRRSGADAGCAQSARPRGTENTMPYLLDAVGRTRTLGEICDALRGVFGTYTETTRL
jgi:methylmalonyl-CoA mutase N-terminal domain/subunit